MADVKPNYTLETQGLELELAQLNINVLSQRYRIAQLNDEQSRIEKNIEATQAAIAALETKISQLKVK